MREAMRINQCYSEKEKAEEYKDKLANKLPVTLYKFIIKEFWDGRIDCLVFDKRRYRSKRFYLKSSMNDKFFEWLLTPNQLIRQIDNWLLR